MINISDSPRITNRGVVNTCDDLLDFEKQGFLNNLGQFIVFDWFQFTIHYDFSDVITSKEVLKDNIYASTTSISNKVYFLFKYLFDIERNDIVYEDKGINGYTGSYSYKDIYMYTTDRLDMGINVKMSGKGCRDYEKLGFSFYDLFSKLSSYIVSYSRLDIAIDDFSNNYFSLKKLNRYIDSHQLVSKFRTYYKTRKGVIETNEVLGDTIQFGSRASLLHITFYDKLKERKNNNYIVSNDIKYWVRTELRFQHEKAKEVINELCNSRDINSLVKGILFNYINFVEKGSDTNRSRWLTSNWWLDFLENVDKVKFMPISLETSIYKKKIWLEESTSKSQFMLLLSTLDNISLDDQSSSFILNLLKNGYDRLEKKDLQFINSYRIDKKLLPLDMDQVNDFIRDLKDIILINSNK